MLEKSSLPQGEPTEPIAECATPKCSSYFPTVRGCTAPPACSWNWKKTAQGKCSHHLRSSEQSGSSCEWSFKGQGIIPDYEQSAGMSIPVLRMVSHWWNGTQFTCSRAQYMLKLSQDNVMQYFEF